MVEQIKREIASFFRRYLEWRGADKEDKNKKLDNSLNVYFNVSSV